MFFYFFEVIAMNEVDAGRDRATGGGANAIRTEFRV
jgi:hypothetical protein